MLTLRPPFWLSIHQSASKFGRFRFCDNFEHHLKGMWMKPGVWQYVDYARIYFWWVAFRRTSSCVVRSQCFECGTVENPIVMKIC